MPELSHKDAHPESQVRQEEAEEESFANQFSVYLVRGWYIQMRLLIALKRSALARMQTAATIGLPADAANWMQTKKQL